MTESGDRIINWYETKGYDFSNKDFLEEMKSGDDVENKIKDLKDFADDISAGITTKKPFSKGTRLL